MAKQSEQEFNPVKTKSDDGGRAEFIGKKKRNDRVRPSVVGDPEGIDRMMSEEFNPVKIENVFRTESEDSEQSEEEPQPEQPKVKTTAAFDNSRLEFLRMQIGPVQNFYQTLGNILFSLSIRVDVAEAKIENLKAHADQLNLERALYKRYGEYLKENQLVWSNDGFVDFIREYAEEEEDETKTDKE